MSHKEHSWSEQLKAGKNPHQLLFQRNRDRRPDNRDHLTVEQRRRYENIRFDKLYTDLDCREVWEE